MRRTKSGGWDKRYKRAKAGPAPEWFKNILAIFGFVSFFAIIIYLLFTEIDDGYFGLGSAATLFLIVSWIFGAIKKRKLTPMQKKIAYWKDKKRTDNGVKKADELAKKYKDFDL